VESLWGRNTATARTVMWDCVNDGNHRVAGNAVYGLHLLGERKADELVTGMLDDERPEFRSTAARLMGRMGNTEFTDALTKASADTDANVRLEAKRALVSIRQPILRQQQQLAAVSRAVESSAPPALPVTEKPAPPPVETEAAVEAGVGSDLHLRLDGRHTSTR